MLASKVYGATVQGISSQYSCHRADVISHRSQIGWKDKKAEEKNKNPIPVGSFRGRNN